MLSVILLLCLFAPYTLDAALPPGFRIRYNYSYKNIGTDAFIPLPQDMKAAAALGWIQVPRPPGPPQYNSLVLYCPNDDYTICVMYEDTGYVAGMQIGLDQEMLYSLIFDMPTIGFTEWSAELGGKPKKFWTLQHYYISGEKLAYDSASRIAARDSSKFIQDNNVFVSGLRGQLIKIPTDPQKFDSIFKQQTCIDGMGRHFYYNITPQFVCEADNMFPWFLLVDDNQLIGLGLLTYARRRLAEGQRNWLEVYSGNTIEYVLRDRVQCLWDIGKNMMVLHTYFVDRPFDIKCRP